jgi:hypothetical protein
MLVKTYLGNLVVNTMNDDHLWLPDATWLRDDLRQTVREKGGFGCEPDEMGNHADCFCAIGAGLHGHITGGGPIHAEAQDFGGDGPRPGRDDFDRPRHDDDGPTGDSIYA